MKNRASFALGFVFMIALGTCLLASPWAQASGKWGRLLPSLFTACSAVCVTGLSIVDIGTGYSTAGQIAILALVQIGGLGLMTLGTFFLIAVGRRLSLGREFSLMNAYGVEQVKGLRGLVAWAVCSTFLIEGVCAAIVYWRVRDPLESAYIAVMSFCNAGLSRFTDSLAVYATDPIVLLASSFATILGGIGFLVIFNLCTFKFLRRSTGVRGRLSLHTRVVLRVTGWLLLAGFAAFLLLEWHGALASCSLPEKLYVGFFQAVTPRTCGLSVTPTEALRPVTRFFYEVLMFIGGAPGSTAGGLKVTTFAVLLYTIRAMCRGDSETVLSCRVVPTDIVRESIVIMTALTGFIVLVFAALLLTDGARLPYEALFFESISAVTTTGLSMGDTTASLSPAGKCIIMLAMFIGRLGALTVVLMIGDRETRRYVRYPTEELVVG